MFTARASKAPLFRRSRIQFLVLCALGIGTLLFIIAKILGFGGGAPPGTPPVVIVTVINPESQSKQYIADIKENREQYAKKHGYATFFPTVHDYPIGDSPPSWAKLPAMRHALTNFPYTEYYWFLDQNALIMNPNLKIETHIMNPKRMDTLMIKDQSIVPPDSVIKTFKHLKGQQIHFSMSQDKDGLAPGSFIVRNGDWSKFLLDTWFDPLYRSYNFQKAERHALEHIVQWHPTILSRLGLVPQNILNSYSRAPANGKTDVYKEGDFVINFEGCDTAGQPKCEDEAKPFSKQWRQAFNVVACDSHIPHFLPSRAPTQSGGRRIAVTIAAASLDVTSSIKELRSFNCSNYHHAGEFEDAYQSAQHYCREDRRLGYPAALAEYRPAAQYHFLPLPLEMDEEGIPETQGQGVCWLDCRRLCVDPTNALWALLEGAGQGWSDETVQKELETLATMDHTRWEDGFVSGAVYHGGNDLIKLQTEAFGKFTVANPIHPDVFPGVRKMEAEIVAMVLGIFNAPPGAAGATTSGGTESILMACLSARQKAYVERGVTEPEMILPDTAHTAFHKAGHYFGIKIHLVACPAPAYQVSIPAVSRLINGNTILLVGSAPNFPHGIIDDIAGLSKLAVARRIPLHVDCCLGSFLVPFLAAAGFPAPLFDFRLRGVTSISCDTHKYGFAPKGNSTVLYRSAKLRTYQYFIAPDWSGGVYASPNMAGSRPGALIAGCWASLMRVGEAGYIAAAHEIVGAARSIADAVRTNPGLSADLQIIGEPLVSVVAVRSSTLDIYDIADGMSAKGWHLNALQNPPAVHVAVTLPVAKVWQKLITDLEAVVEAEREKERERGVNGRKKGEARGDSAALYGVAGSLPNKSVVVELAGGFLDTLYKA
ncbi:hypothetical protein V502_02785 [Pseudogymnoascus sp. VKM F-4520 (FW-2644)]|nr:hypothetical protein V502_02785 [Pseudogymnoascus sp. VKM F-4520 (FW-2644)]